GSEIKGETKQQYYNSAGNTSEVEFTFAEAPSKDADVFVSWAIGSKDGEKHQPGDVIKSSENITAYAVWESDTVVTYTVTYDYSANGGSSITAAAASVSVNSGDKADLSVDAYKDTYEFVGWNTDKNATEGMTQYIVTEDVTLYAIFKKTVMAQFMNEANDVQSVQYAVLYNNADTAAVTAPEPLSKDGWETDGWRSDTEAAPASCKSGAVRISGDTYFYPVYKRFITLSYDINEGNGPIRPDTALQYMNGFGNTQEIPFTLAAAPQRSGYSFTGWTVNADPTRSYQSGEIINLTGNAVASALWSEIQVPDNSVSVTYDYSSNGGSRTTKAYDTLESGANADLTPDAVKAGFEFVGWNTDKNAQTALAEYTVTENTTLYAIYKKDITANFYSGENVLQDTVSRTLWNNESEAVVTAPEPLPLEGWTAVGWRDNKHALENEYQSGEIRISDDTDFYAIYSRDITVSETAADGESTTTVSFNQYYNACGGAQSRTVMLEEPEPREGYRFRGWQVGDDTSKRYKPGTPVTVSESTSIVGLWVQLPEGDVKLPSVQTGDASVASSTSAAISAKVESDGGSEVIERGFVYWSKLNSGSKYTVLTNADEVCALSNLSPDTEYYYYAFAENAAGTGKGYIRSFATASDNKPNALMITPEYVSIEKDSVYQLLATLLPASAKNRAIVWSSSDESVAKVDSEGKVTGLKAGQAVITATTEVDRLSAECIVDVTETEEIREYDFSEWNMATNTSSFATDGLGFDWDTTNYGGNHQMATAYLARWDGAVLEENDQYPAFNNNPAASYEEKDADYHIQNVEWLPAREGPLDNDEIKSALMEYGAVYTLFNIDWKYFDDTMLNYYSPTELSSGGHCVTIVGWDDNYSKSNFKVQPPGNGAFLCKNSWGEYSGDGGYFYISYYDAQMGRMDSNAVVTGMEKNSNYNKIYQYDPLGAVGYIGWYDTTYAANVFPENGKTLSQDEDLRAVSFYTYHKNTSYDVYIVTDYKDSASLSKLWTPSASGVIENSGYHTINLNTPVSLKAGTRFAVVVKLDTPGECSYVYCEYPVSGYSSKARANADESYYGPDGEEWYDLTEDVDNANFCIKAFTDNGLALSSEQLFSGIDNAEREYESDTVYTLSQAVEKGLPVNDAYIDYVDRAEEEAGQMSVMSDNEKAMGSVPSITKAGANSVTFTDGAVFPSSYDLREMGLVSSVKDQGQWGTCWAHTMYASLESNLLRSMKTTAADSSGTVPTDMLLSRGELTMAPGASITLAKKITPVSAADKAVVWISSDESVATVDTNGTIRAVGGGLANIAAVTVSGGICSQCSVVVEEQELEEVVSFEEKRVNKSIDDVFMVAYSVTPMKSEASSFGWISDNTNAAVVNENGVITAVAEGTAEISIISDKGEIKDSVMVVVGEGFNCEIGNMVDNGLTFSDNALSGDVTVTINNNAASDRSAAVTLAIYDGNDVMAGVITESKLLSPGENQIAFNDIAFDGIQAGSYTLKCFVWDSLSGAAPLSAAADKQVLVN
ncbi:MAG: lectin like domain-containing protein, partial [Candidatus Ornithomonoglobus sp.]